MIIGIDEAGRGSLLSSIVACAIVQNDGIMTENTKIIIRDSKKMTPLQRKKTRKYLEDNCIFGIGSCNEKEIDEKGIQWCNMTAMHRAIDSLCEKNPTIEITKILVDGNRFKPYNDIPYELVIHGDSCVPVISCASILAKTIRDQWIEEQCEKEDLYKYGIKNNKGYGTKQHIEALRQYGSTPFHRQTFIQKIVKKSLNE